jgi:hypothetical protein
MLIVEVPPRETLISLHPLPVSARDNKGATPPALKLEGVRQEIELDMPGVSGGK